MRILHPLLGAGCPTLDELVERAEPEAAAVLRVAARLAAWRLDCQARARALKDELEAPPWSGARPSWSMPPSVLLPADLARALLVEQPHLLHDAMFEREPVSREVLEQARERFGRALEASVEGPPAPLSLLRAWGRRLALGMLDQPQLRLSARHLVCASLTPEWVEMIELYREGVVTREEARIRLHDSLAQATERGILPGSPIDPPLPEPYLDHHGRVFALEGHLVRGPGAVLLGAPGSGRHALARACWWRHRRGEGPAALRGYGFNVDRFYEVPSFDDHGSGARLRVPPEMSDHCVLALVHHGIEAALDPTAELHREWLATLEEGLRMSLEPALGFRLVLGLTPAQHHALGRHLPALAKLPTIEIPTPGPRETVALWLCKVFELEERAQGSIDLARIIVALSRRRREQRLDFEVMDDVLAPAPRIVGRMVMEQRWRKNPDAAVPRKVEQLLARLELDLDDLAALTDMAEPLLGPR